MESDNDDFDLDFDLSIVQRMPWLETPLTADKNRIRLVQLEAGSGDDQIICKLQVVSLDDDPYYEALSYVCALEEYMRLYYLTVFNRYGVIQARPSVSSSVARALMRRRI